MVGMAIVIYAFMWYWFRRENQQRADGKIKEEHRGLTEEELMELGDESPHYRYTV